MKDIVVVVFHSYRIKKAGETLIPPALCLLRKNEPGVDKPAALSDFEVQVCTGRISSASGCADPLTGIYALAYADADHAQVGVQG